MRAFSFLDAGLEELVVALGENSIDGLADYIEVYSNPESVPSDTATQGPLIRFTGANVQIVSGERETNAQVNGVGNLVVGYDESRSLPSQKEYSDGRHKDSTLCLKGNGEWKSNHKSGSHNLIVGPYHNYSRYGGFVVGSQNSITGMGASVNGGKDNKARFKYSSLTGGSGNETHKSNSATDLQDVLAKADEALLKARSAALSAQQNSESLNRHIQRSEQP